MERAIRNNPNTSEIHYERSILGDIYHCAHDCGQPGRLMPSYSDPNIFSSGGSFTPPRTMLASIEIHDGEEQQQQQLQQGTLESSDSGLPGTPQPEDLSSTGIPSPTSSNKSNPFRSPRHQHRHQRSPSVEGEEKNPAFRRRQSDETPSAIVRRRSDETPSSPPYCTMRSLANSQPKQTSPNNGRVQYAMINHDSPGKLVRPAEYVRDGQRTTSVPYATVNTAVANTAEQVPRDRRNNYNKLKTLEESTEADDAIYDIPNCEPPSDPVFPSSAPARSYMDTFAKSPVHRPSSISPKHSYFRTSPTSTVSGIRSPMQHVPVSPYTHHVPVSPYSPGTDLQDREEDYEEAWVPPVPKHKFRGQQKSHVPPQTNHVRVPLQAAPPARRRFQSSSDVLEAPKASSFDARRNRAKSISDNVELTTRTRTQSMALNGYDRQLEKASNDFLKRLNEEEEKLTKVLAASRKEKNEELGEEAKDRLGDLNRPYMFNMDDLDHDYSDPDVILETCSNLVDYHTSTSQPSYLPSRMLTKEPRNNIKGYAYKVQIPFTNTQYDVPRRAAGAPDLTTMSHDAPPKPKRHISAEHLYFINH